MTLIEQVRAELAAATAALAEAQQNHSRLSAALAALEGKPAPAPTLPAAKPRPVVDLVLETALDMPEGATFDFKSLKDAGARLFPSQAERIATGVYGACAKLVQTGKFKLVPGGHQCVR